MLKQIPPESPAWRSLERQVDERALSLEAQRDLSRIILHADMDMFYAAVELKRDPSLRGKAFGVGSGVLVTASYEARKKGCRSGMATHVALALCPELIVVKNDMSSYVAASQQFMAIFEEYDPNYAQMSLDEAYMDITSYCEMNGMTSDDVVTELRERVKKETGLTVSVGIAPNKMLAKISSDRNKPDGQFCVVPDRNFIIDMMRNLPCRKIPGIGRVTERILSSLKVETCGDIWEARVTLSLLFGDIDWLLNAYLGIHSNIVEPAKREERRSVGREHTFRPTKDVSELKKFLRQSAEQVQKDLERLDFRGKTITLTCKTDTFRRFTRAKTVLSYRYLADDLFELTSKLLDAEIAAHGGLLALRLIGVRVSSLKDLREPEHGGLKKLFSNASHGTSKRSRTVTNDEAFEEEEEALQQALRRSLEECEDQDHLQSGLKRKESLTDLPEPRPSPSTMEGKDSSAVVCPVCCKTLFLVDADSDDNAANAKLNSHIDFCLTGHTDTLTELSPFHHVKKRKTLEAFFSKQPC